MNDLVRVLGFLIPVPLAQHHWYWPPKFSPPHRLKAAFEFKICPCFSIDEILGLVVCEVVLRSKCNAVAPARCYKCLD